MKTKYLTLCIDLTQYGQTLPVPVEDGPARLAALKHNRGVKLRRAMEAANIAAQAQPLHLTVHVGRYGVLLRGPEERVSQLVVPKDTHIRDASERWRGYR